jgi:hypothetical protein
METFNQQEFKELLGPFQYAKLITEYVDSLQDDLKTLKPDFYYYDFSLFKGTFDDKPKEFTIEFVYHLTEESVFKIAINNVFIKTSSDDADELLDRINELDKLNELNNGED